MMTNNENRLGYKKIFVVMMFLISICLGGLCGCATKSCEASCEPLEYAEGAQYIWQRTNMVSGEPMLTDVTDNISILIDTHTGIQYIFFEFAGYTGLSPLLDSNGSPILADIDEIKDVAFD